MQKIKKLIPILFFLLFLSRGNIVQASMKIGDTYRVRTALIQYIPPEGISSIDSSAAVPNPVDFTKNVYLPALSNASKYHGYKDPSATKALLYTLYDEDIFTENNFPPRTIGSGGKIVFDYAALFKKYNLCNYAIDNDIGMVIIWAHGVGPYNGGTWEAAITGSKNILTNGAQLPYCPQRTILILGLNYQRGLGEAMESYGHHLERAFTSKVGFPLYSAWTGINKIYSTTLDSYPGSGKDEHCGGVHDAPNARFEYDRTNKDSVRTDCQSWDGTNKPNNYETINCSAWGCSYAGYLTWWMQNIPGVGNNLYFNNKKVPNWWVLVGDPDHCADNPLGCGGISTSQPTTAVVQPTPSPAQPAPPKEPVNLPVNSIDYSNVICNVTSDQNNPQFTASNLPKDTTFTLKAQLDPPENFSPSHDVNSDSEGSMADNINFYFYSQTLSLFDKITKQPICTPVHYTSDFYEKIKQNCQDNQTCLSKISNKFGPVGNGCFAGVPPFLPHDQAESQIQSCMEKYYPGATGGPANSPTPQGESPHPSASSIPFTPIPIPIGIGSSQSPGETSTPKPKTVVSIQINNEEVYNLDSGLNKFEEGFPLHLPGTEGKAQTFNIPVEVIFSDGTKKFFALNLNYKPIPPPPSQAQACTYSEAPQNCSNGGTRTCTGSLQDGVCKYDTGINPNCNESCNPQPLPAQACTYSEAPQNCSNGGTRTCTGTMQSGVCKYDAGVEPNCHESCNAPQTCNYSEQPQDCPHGGTRSCTGSIQGGVCKYDGSVNPNCQETCNTPQVCSYSEQPQSCSHGGTRTCTGTIQGGVCKYDPNINPNCNESCNQPQICTYSETPQGCSYGGTRTCTGSLQSGVCKYDGGIAPNCHQSCNAPPASSCTTSCGKYNGQNCTNKYKADIECADYYNDNSTCNFTYAGGRGDGCIP